MVRIEMQLTQEEVAIIEQIAKEQGRSRKKQCEFYLKKMIAGAFIKEKEDEGAYLG